MNEQYNKFEINGPDLPGPFLCGIQRSCSQQRFQAGVGPGQYASALLLLNEIVICTILASKDIWL